MECPPKPSSVVVPGLMILLLVFVMAAKPGIAALKLEPTGTSSTTHIQPLLDCAPAPAGAAPASNHSAFGDNLLALLGALPPATAAAPTGFAAAQSGPGGGDRAFAHAFCFGFGARGGSGDSPGDCRECLSAAAPDVADGCHGRRGAVWRAGCFLAYADTNASTAREDAFRGWFYDDYSADDTPAAALGSECMPNRAAAECSRCLNDSAQVVPSLKGGRQLSLVHGDAVVVVGYSCYLRVPLFAPTTTGWVTYAVDVFDVAVVVLIEIGGILFCIRLARDFNPG